MEDGKAELARRERWKNDGEKEKKDDYENW